MIKSSIYMTVFLSFYMLVMRKTTFFRLNRNTMTATTSHPAAMLILSSLRNTASMVSPPQKRQSFSESLPDPF